MRRFYRSVSVVATAEGFAVALDDRPIRTPASRPLVVPVRSLAAEIAAEWAAQGATIRPDSLRLTRLANAGIDIVAPRRAAVIDEIARFARTDLLCYRASDDAALRRRQDAIWQPLLDWSAERFGARLEVAESLSPHPQPVAALEALRAAVAAYEDLELAALNMATATAGSVVVALALAEGRIDSNAAFDCAELDASFQIERWGEDEEASARRAALRCDLAAAAIYLGLLRR